MEHYLEVFVNLLEDSEHRLPQELCVRSSIEVFNTFIQSKLSVPRGWRKREREEGEIVEDEDDREMYSDQLHSAGFIARTIPDYSLSLLVKLIGESASACVRFLSEIGSGSNSLDSQRSAVLNSIYEDLHWLVLTAGYTLCDIAKGEDILVPSQLLKHSLQRQNEVQATIADVRTLILNEQVDLSAAKLDPVVSLVFSVCRLAGLDKLFASRGLLEVLSPQLSSTIVWCLAEITGPYLHLNGDGYIYDQVRLLKIHIQLTSART